MCVTHNIQNPILPLVEALTNVNHASPLTIRSASTMTAQLYSRAYWISITSRGSRSKQSPPSKRRLASATTRLDLPLTRRPVAEKSSLTSCTSRLGRRSKLKSKGSSFQPYRSCNVRPTSLYTHFVEMIGIHVAMYWSQLMRLQTAYGWPAPSKTNPNECADIRSLRFT